MSFQDKVVLVTGASAGIGQAIALHFAKEKAILVVVGRNKDALERVGQLCSGASGREAVVVQADVSKDDEVERIVSTVARAHHGALHVLVNNAGVFVSDDVDTATADNFDTHISTNLRGVFNLTRLCVPLLVKAQGNIVNISGVEADKYCQGLLTESISKAGVQHLTKYLGKELAPKKVRANSLVLGYMADTKIIERANMDPEEFAKDWLPRVPLGEAIRPQEVARVVAFIASDASRHITGQNIVMDGGYSCY